MTFHERLNTLRQQLSLIIDDLEKATVEYETDHKDGNLNTARSRLNETLAKLVQLEDEIKTSIREKEDVIEDSNRELASVQKEILERTTMTTNNLDAIRAAVPRENDAKTARRTAISNIAFNVLSIGVLIYGIYKL